MAWFAVALPYISAAVGVGAAAVSYEGQRKAASQSEDVSLANAAAMDANATLEEDAARKRLKLLMGSQRALYAKAGVDLSTGSPLTVLAATAYEGEKEAKQIGAAIRRGADITRTEGSNYAKAGRTAAGGTLLSGLASSAGSAYSTYRTPKVANA